MITSIMPAGSTLAVSWNPVDNAMHYTVYYKQGGGPVSKSDYGGRLDFASSGIEVSGLQSGMMYAFVVTAFCPGEPPGEGPDSPIMTAVAH
jgi:hypothetical protein